MSLREDVARGVAGPALSGRDEWDSHWDQFGEANERNPAQDYRRSLALRLLSRRGRPARLLDIGSGNGALLGTAAQRWPEAELLGIELSGAAVVAAQAKVPSAKFIVCDLTLGSEPAQRFGRWATHAVCSEVLEHVDDPVILLQHAREWLAPGCRLVITVPGGPRSAFDRHIGHRRHFSAPELREVMEAAGLGVLRVGGAGFPFFNLYRGLVVLRGEKLIDHASSDAAQTAGGVLTRAAMAAFRPLLFASLPSSPLGWQTIGVGQEPYDRASGGLA